MGRHVRRAVAAARSCAAKDDPVQLWFAQFVFSGFGPKSRVGISLQAIYRQSREYPLSEEPVVLQVFRVARGLCHMVMARRGITPALAGLFEEG